MQGKEDARYRITKGDIAVDMRLKQRDVQAIIAEFKKTFGSDDHLWLFGSRVYDDKKGGDIDLYIQTRLPGEEVWARKSKFVTGMWHTIGEQKIDVVLHLVDDPFHLPIYDVAQQEGILLV